MIASELLDRYVTREPFTQSLGWAAVLQRRGWSCVFAGRAFAMVGQGKHGLFAKMQRPRAIDVMAITEIIARGQISRFLVEPSPVIEVVTAAETTTLRFDPARQEEFESQLARLGWTLTPDPVAHTKTRIVDLSGGADAALKTFSASTRRNVRLALVRSKVRYEVVPFSDLDDSVEADIRELYLSFLSSRPWLDDDWVFRQALVRGFGPDGYLVLARDGRQLVGVLYLVMHDRVGSYYATFANADATSDRVPSGLAFSAMETAAAHGCDIFDFAGVADERYAEKYRRWHGFSTFKERFGGEPVYLPPSFDVIAL